MRKTIVISGIECNMKSSAAIPRMYRLKFKRDIFKDMAAIAKRVKQREKLIAEMKEKCEKEGREFDEDSIESDMPIESLEMFENIAYLMHKHGDPSQPDDINDWLDQFDFLDIYKILPQITEMWQDENRQMSVAKKNKMK